MKRNQTVFSETRHAAVLPEREHDNAGEGLTPEQLEALDAFRTQNGRNWKSVLRANWERARYPNMTPDHAAALQRIRNTLGPEWLAKFRPQELRKDESADRLQAIKAALGRGGEDPTRLDQMLGTLRAQNVANLDDAEIDRAFGSVVMAHFCTQYVKAARSCGLTLDDVYRGATLPRDASTPVDALPKPQANSYQEPGALEKVTLAEQRLQALGLEILSSEDLAAWNREKNIHGSLYPDVDLSGWVDMDGFLTKEFYVRDPDGLEIGLYRKAWFGDYAGGEDKEIFITDHDGNELKAGSDSLEP